MKAMMVILMLSVTSAMKMSNSMMNLLISFLFIKMIFNFIPFLSMMVICESYFLLDQMSLILTLLTLMIYFFMSLGGKEMRMNKEMHNMITLMMIILILLAFTVKPLMGFYLFFEISLIPMFLLVMGWGYQPERLTASINLLFYTITSSMPLLLVILTASYSKSFPEFYNILYSSAFSYSPLTNWLTWAVLISMMVKFPMFSVHLWLPKAHVEAPVDGSMFLAAIMLKLAGYGVARFMPFLPISPMMLMLQSISMAGGAIVSFICLRQTDMKVMIAYSSVAHMSFAIFGVCSKTLLGLQAAIFMMAAHGISSSGMFFGANMFYSEYHTRNMALIKGSLALMPLTVTMWFLLCVGNFGGPPTINLMAEVLAIIASMNSSYFMMIPISLLTFLASAYSLLLFSNLIQGKLSNFIKISHFTIFRETLTLSIHCFYLIMLFSWFL